MSDYAAFLGPALQMQPCDLQIISGSGQVFDWGHDTQGRYCMKSDNNLAFVTQETDCIDVDSRGGDKDFWENYFDSAFDYEAAYQSIIDYNPELVHVYRFGYGMRILRQNWWEASVAFIISQNNNIPRIRKIMQAIGYMRFPSPEALVRHLETNTYGLGYRLPYLKKFAEAVAEGWKPSAIIDPDISLYDQEWELRKLDGIGPKVANCICLYGLGYKDACPHDVWIKRAEDEMGIRWHPELAGLQQQLIFYWMRNRACGTDEEMRGGSR